MDNFRQFKIFKFIHTIIFITVIKFDGCFWSRPERFYDLYRECVTYDNFERFANQYKPLIIAECVSEIGGI